MKRRNYEFTKTTTLWRKFRTGEYGEGCGQYKDCRRRKKSNLNNFLLECVCAGIIVFCASVLWSLISHCQLNSTTFFIGLYFACASAFLTALCLGAIILSLSRVWDDTKQEDVKKRTYSDKSKLIYDFKYGGQTMEEFSRCVAEKLSVLQKMRKDF